MWARVKSLFGSKAKRVAIALGVGAAVGALCEVLPMNLQGPCHLAAQLCKLIGAF